MEDNLIRVLDLLKKQGSQPWPTILQRLDIHLPPLQEQQLKTCLLQNNFIDEELEPYGVRPYCNLSGNGEDVQNNIAFYRDLDKILIWLNEDFRKNGNKASAYSLEEICKNGDINIRKADYGKYEFQLMYDDQYKFVDVVVSKDGNAFNMKNRAFDMKVNSKFLFTSLYV